MNAAILVGAALLLAVPTLAQTPEKGQDTTKQEHKQDHKTAGYAPGATVDGTLALKDLQGKEKKLSDFTGKVTVVDFWSIECPISKGWEERLKAIAADYTKKDVNFVAINSNVSNGENKDKTKLTAYVEKTKIPYTILIDEHHAVADKFGATHTPHVFVLDAKGVVKYVGAIDDDESGKAVKKQYLRDALDATLAGKEPATKQTPAKGCTIKRETAAKDASSEKGGKKGDDHKKGDEPKKH